MIQESISYSYSLPPPVTHILFNQLENHVDPSSSGNFTQNVWLIESFFQENGPIFFLAGPEAKLDDNFAKYMQTSDMARKMNGMVIVAEHRNFGSSQPNSGFKYLNLENTLMDYIEIIRDVKAKNQSYRNSKVITVGGSYGGFLSMMLRVKYPQDVFASLASAAPVYFISSADGPHYAWYDTVVKIYKEKDAECADKISYAFEQLSNMLVANNYSQVQSELNLCQAPDNYSSTSFMRYIMHAFSQISQFNNYLSLFTKGPFPFEKTCNTFKSSSSWQESLKFALDTNYNVSGRSTKFWICPSNVHSLDVSFENSWFYIDCVLNFHTKFYGSESENFFHWNFTYDEAFAFQTNCKSKYGINPPLNPPVTIEEIQKSSRILFSNMGYDPVHGQSIQESISDSIILLNINEASHGQDLDPTNSNDSSELNNARAKELEIFSQWLLE
jgi:pimeloyl-ACP methyl ester carboxylesterase